MKKVSFGQEPLFGTGLVPATGVGDYSAYLPTGEKGARLGTYYDCLALKMQAKMVRVKIEGAMPLITQEELDAATIIGEFVKLRFENLVATPYVKDGRMEFSCKADKAIIVAPPTSK